MYIVGTKYNVWRLNQRAGSIFNLTKDELHIKTRTIQPLKKNTQFFFYTREYIAFYGTFEACKSFYDSEKKKHPGYVFILVLSDTIDSTKRSQLMKKDTIVLHNEHLYLVEVKDKVQVTDENKLQVYKPNSSNIEIEESIQVNPNNAS